MEAREFRQQLEQLIRRINRQASSTFTPIVEQYGITPVQAHILRLVRCSGRVRVGDVAKELSLSSGNASSICKKIERTGYLRRERGEEDERTVFLTLTEEGIAQMDAMEREMAAAFDCFYESYPQERLEKVLEGMEAMRQALYDIEVARKELEKAHTQEEINA